ncbi:MAG TPA: hypothetical protein VKD90_07450 [Gemmataceae bacterium]|nr:hypothetical protein [Gemmataceae bacterium]
MEPHADWSSGDDQQRIGAVWEAAGLLPQGEYVKLHRLTADVQANGGVISDADLDWAIALLESTPEVVVRARVMAMLAVLGQPTALPQEHRARIGAAVAPYLHSERKLDRLAAAHVQQALVARE